MQITGGYCRLQEVTGGYCRLQEVTAGYRLFEVTGGYCRFACIEGVNTGNHCILN